MATAARHPGVLRFVVVVWVFAAACSSQTSRVPETAQPSREQPIASLPAPAARVATGPEPPEASAEVPESRAPVPIEDDPAEAPADDPHLLERLTIAVAEPGSLRAGKFRAARDVFIEVKRHVVDRSYAERKDVRCLQALVSDPKGVVRGFAQLGGTEHHYAEFRHYFDGAGALRLLLHKRTDEAGGSTEDIVAFDSAGEVVACGHVVHRSGMPAPDLCAAEPEPAVDPEVKKAMRASASQRSRNEMREYLQTIDPVAEFKHCPSE